MNNPINLKHWIQENKAALQPPVCNKLIFPAKDYIIMAVGGPNAREDYHVNEGEEIFMQVEGILSLKIIEAGKPKTITVQAGETYLLAGNVPHSPQRPAQSLGIVIEKVRQPGQRDGFQWYCQQCHEKMYEVFVHIDDIVKQLPEIFNDFYQNSQQCTCQHCGWVAKASGEHHVDP